MGVDETFSASTLMADMSTNERFLTNEQNSFCLYQVLNIVSNAAGARLCVYMSAKNP